MSPVPRRAIRRVPDALERFDEIREALRGRAPVLFLDYDGTLTPIVDDPARARLPAETREVLERLRRLCPVAVVSGRDLAEVRRLVGVEGLHYAGSHGFDVLTPAGERRQRGSDYLPALARAEGKLAPLVDSVDGAWLERKAFALAVHYRKLDDPGDASRIEKAVDQVAGELPRLRKTAGKKVFELRPDMDWDKGRAVLAILENTEGPDQAALPIYLGDDVTDEDAFRALDGRGLSLVVRGEDDGRETAADYALADPDAVRTLLRKLVRTLEDAGSRTRAGAGHD